MLAQRFGPSNGEWLSRTKDECARTANQIGHESAISFSCGEAVRALIMTDQMDFSDEIYSWVDQDLQMKIGIGLNAGIMIVRKQQCFSP